MRFMAFWVVFALAVYASGVIFSLYSQWLGRSKGSGDKIVWIDVAVWVLVLIGILSLLLKLIYGRWFFRPISDRFDLIVQGYALACLAASAAIGVVIVARGVLVPLPKPLDFAELLAGAVLMTTFALMYVPILALLPAIAVILLVEIYGVRSPVLYAIFGGVTGLVPIAVCAVLSYLASGTAKAFFVGSAPIGTAATQIIAIAGLPGMCGGLVYWMVAGRSAGSGISLPSPTATLQS